MRWLVVGAGGMLGRDMVARLASDGRDVQGAARGELDVTDAASCDALVSGFDVVVNCAAWTAVDDAEDHEAEAFAVNARAVANLGQAATKHGARLVQVSTDYVFDGTATQPYAEDAALAPVSAYGRTKAAGEWAARATGSHHVVRTAWLYGASGSSFPKTIARLAATRGAVAVVEDQLGQPTWTADVADLIVHLVDAGVDGGIFHATSGGSASWYDFARVLVATAGLDPSIVTPTTSAEFVRPAPRPAFSVLGHAALDNAGIEPIGPWTERWAAAGPEVLGL